MSQTAPPTSGPGSPGRAGRPDPGAPALVASGGRQRRWSLALIAVLLTVGSGLAFVVLWLNAGDRQPYLAVTSDVAAGQVIEAGDLTTVRVSTDPALTPVSASDRDQVVGQVAATDLAAGSLLVEGAVGEDEGLAPGKAMIGVPVEAQRLPSPLPEASQTVRIFAAGDGGGTGSAIETETEAGAGDAGAAAVADGTVLAVEDFDSHVTFTLLVNELDLTAIAAAVESGGVNVAVVNES